MSDGTGRDEEYMYMWNRSFSKGFGGLVVELVVELVVAVGSVRLLIDAGADAV